MTRSNPHRILSICITLSLFIQSISFAFSPTTFAASQPAAIPPSSAAAPEAPSVPTAVANEPDALTQPVAISRIQSAYHTNDLDGNRLTIEYTITNNELPTAVPETSGSATYTETVNILASFNVTDDMNTLHDVVLETTLLSGVSYVDSSLPPTQNGNDFTWQLPDIWPLASYNFTVTVEVPAAVTDFTNLDTGAAVSATLWDGTIGATARPAVLAPDSIDASYTRGTVDANLADRDMLWQTAVFQQDPAAAFSYVRSFDYEPYKGSLRGTRGTLWSEAGNSLDQASLLIAILRSAGIPARYRHGTLDTAEAQTLIASMFLDTQGMAGYVPGNAPVADPLNNNQLIALVQDHWWVEAYLPGQGWTNMDPSFPGANVGDIFATPGSNDRIAEVPDNLRHKVNLTLEVEKYTAFPIGGTFLQTFTPLTATYSLPEIAAKPVSIGYFVDTVAPPGLVFGSVTHSYTPYFAVDGDDFITLGDEYQDLLTSFPLASQFTTAQWLTVETEDVDGNTETFTRVVKDLLGLDVRLNGGTPVIELPADNRPFTDFDDAFAMWFLPHRVASIQYSERMRTDNTYNLLQSARLTNALPETPSTPEEELAFDEARIAYFRTRNQHFALGGLVFTELADPVNQALEESFRVKLYYDQPRIIIASSAVQPDETVAVTMDLRSTEAEALVYPGQANEAEATIQWAKALAESRFEGVATYRLTDEIPVSTARIFNAMAAQAIEPILVTPDDLDILEFYLTDPDSYAYAVQALLEGKSVLIPQAPVQLDGESLIAWWEIDPVSGIAVSVLENGQHGTAAEYHLIASLVGLIDTLNTAGGFKEKVEDLYKCNNKYLIPALQGNPIGSGDCVKAYAGGRTPTSQSGGRAQSAAWNYLPAHLCPVANCGIEQFTFSYLPADAIPLPNMGFGYDRDTSGSSRAGQVQTVSGSGGTPAISLSTTPGSGSVLPAASHAFDININANFNGLVDAWVYAPEGWDVAFDSTGTAVVTPTYGLAPGTYTLQIVAQSQDHPTAVATHQHSVTVQDANSLSLTWYSEPNITIPMADADSGDVSNQTNDGEAEIPDSAFRLEITNLSAQTRTVTVDLTGAPTGWLVLDGRQQDSSSFDLGPNEQTQVGLYVLPPTLPAPGTSFNILVDVTAPGGSASDTIPWNMPGQAHNQVTVEPEIVFVEANGSADFTLEMENVGNAAGTFPINAVLPVAGWSLSNVPPDLTLAVGQNQTVVPTINVVNGELGRLYPILFGSDAPGTYTQYEEAWVQIVTPESGTIFEVAYSCTLPNETALPALVEGLAYAVVDLEASCQTGDCSLYLRDGTVAAVTAVADRAEIVSEDLTAVAALRTVASDLASHTSPADINNDIIALAAAIGALDGEICELAEHSVSLRFTPAVEAALTNQTVTYTLDVNNLGTVTTTYAITVDLPAGVQTFNDTIGAGTTASYSYGVGSPTLGTFVLQAEAVAAAPDVQLPISDRTDANLRVVDKFIQLTAVSPMPPFVETGVSSTTLNIEVSNVANLARNAVAQTAVIAPGGGISYTGNISLTLAAGNPRSYALTTLNTSGWQEGAYTVTVNLVDGGGSPIPDGSGFGTFGVGEALALFHSAGPSLVPPGDITVTTRITTEIREGTILTSAPVSRPAAWVSTGLRVEEGDQSAVIGDRYAVSGEQNTPLAAGGVVEAARPVAAGPANDTRDANSPATLGTAIIRTENDEAGITYSGSWSTINSNYASSGSFNRSDTAGDTASFSFNGDWAGVSFNGGTGSGQVEIFVDGVSQEIIDLYRRKDEAIGRYYTFPISASHTISVSVLGTSHPNASNSRVNVDFFDYWNGTTLPDGTFEQDDAARVFLSTNWATINNGAASGGSYARSSFSTAWFPFTGDSLTYQAFAYGNGGWAKVYIDGRYQTTLDLYSPVATTRTLSFDGLGAGPHVVQVSSYRGLATIDAFTTPGSAPFFPPPAPTGIIRYEEDDSAILYNGETYTKTGTSWSEVASSYASDGYYLRSSTSGAVIEFDFNGTWVGLGFVGGTNGGQAEIFIDGTSQGAVDLYRRDVEVVSVYYDNLINASHTISVTVLGTGHPNASGTRVNLDYIDTWDGTPLADGTFEAELGNESRLFLSRGWGSATNSAASGGAYVRDSAATAWFPFTGDSVSYRAFAYASGGTAKLYLDGRFLTTLYLYHPTAVSRTLSFDGLGAGPHVLQVSSYKSMATVDNFTTPGSGPFYSPPHLTGVSRYEEDHPAILYNGETYSQTTNSWSTVSFADASRGYFHRSNTANDTISFAFDGTWVALGFSVGVGSGEAEIFIDGASQGVVDLYNNGDDSRELVYSGLVSATHTVSVTVLGTANPSATNTRVNLDFIDVWDGTPAPDGVYEPFDTFLLDGRVDMSHDWSAVSDSLAVSGSYYQNGDNAWFRFTGDTVTLLAFTHNNVNAEIEVYIDGVSQGIVDLTYGFSDTPLPLHYTGLGGGAHVLRVKGVDRARIDTFEANPTTLNPGLPMVEWWDATPAGSDGVISTVAAGDVNNDGLVEVAVSSNNGNLYLFQGDGSDTGGGTPILWSYATGGEPDAPVMAELDGNPGVEIFVGSDTGVHALHSDGSLYWFTDTVKTGFPAGGASAGNLDADSEAEIVVAADNSVVIFEGDGTIAHEFTSFNDQVLPPVLADLTGDGLLDILVAQPSDDTVYLLDYNQGVAPAIAWSRTLTSDLSSLRGAPAVANIDGDPEPELVVTSSGFVTALNHDGTLLWITPVGTGAPGGVSIADTDGDGEVEIITTVQFNNGTIYVLNADGTLLWQAPATDNTSGTSASAHDLDGDGIWEVIWNGAGMGLVVYNGADGQILFNEPIINSITRTDFPVVVDVDNDGHAEILAGDPGGFYVVGYDTVWAASRDLWNQYNYHVTNVNDDLTVPLNEPNSWEIHNTYRTQTPLNAFAVYGVSVSHTVAISGVNVLTNTFSAPPTDNYPLYNWDYTQFWYEPQRTISFDSALTNLQPGEVRQVAEGTKLAYTLPSGRNELALPPLYVSAAHIIALEPATQTVGAGGTAVYTVTLTNLSSSPDTYNLSKAGLPVDWPISLPSSVLLPPNSTVQVTAAITVPLDAGTGLRTFAVTAVNGSGGSEPASAFLNVGDTVSVAINPPEQTAAAGEVVSYTLTITNPGSAAQTYDLAATGLAVVTVPAQVPVGASSSVSLTIGAVADRDGPYGFSITAASPTTGESDTDSALLLGVGDRAVDIAISPATAVVGRGSSVVYTVTITNLGTIADSYDLALTVPNNWQADLNLNGSPVSSVTLPPHVYNSYSLQLLVTSDAAAAPGSYPISIEATSQVDGNISDVGSGSAIVLDNGVQVEIVSGPAAVDPDQTAVWDVRVTNTGLVQDSFDLIAAGYAAATGSFTPPAVTLGAGQSQIVQLAADLSFAGPGSYDLAVVAQSASNAGVRAEDATTVMVNGVESVAVEWLPVSQTVTGTLTATFYLSISNTGNIGTLYDVQLALGQLAVGELSSEALYLPAGAGRELVVTVVAPGAGVYQLDATAVSPNNTSDTASATLAVVSDVIPPPGEKLYLPIVFRPGS